MRSYYNTATLKLLSVLNTLVMLIVMSACNNIITNTYKVDSRPLISRIGVSYQFLVQRDDAEEPCSFIYRSINMSLNPPMSLVDFERSAFLANCIPEIFTGPSFYTNDNEIYSRDDVRITPRIGLVIRDNKIIAYFVVDEYTASRNKRSAINAAYATTYRTIELSSNQYVNLTPCLITHSESSSFYIEGGMPEGNWRFLLVPTYPLGIVYNAYKSDVECYYLITLGISE